jgi:prepilin-type N-terminal cleavage/methylation domain-containing protein
MHSQRGYTLIELLIAVGMIGVATAIALPVFLESNARNALWTGSERVGSTIRQARLKAISTNTTHRVMFDCPSAGQLRTLVVTGDPDVDDALNRCSVTLDGDSAVIELPNSISYDAESATGLQVTGRGVFTAIGDSIPLEISVNYGTTVRTLRVSNTGQITFSNVH